MKRLIYITLVLFCGGIARADFPVVGTFYPTPSDSNAPIQKLVINADSTIDVTCIILEPRDSIRLGKLERKMEAVTKEVRGSARYTAKADEFFSKMEAAEIARTGSTSDSIDALRIKYSPFRNAGYQHIVMIRVPANPQPLYYTFARKDSLFVDIDTGLKLKKSWW
jgi:hypothetical protein